MHQEEKQGNNWITTHDTIFYYTKSENDFNFNKQYIPYTQDYIEQRFIHDDNDGKGSYRLQGKDRKQYLTESKGVSTTSVWDINDINVMAIERLDYATQNQSH